MSTIPDKLKALRTKRGITQKELANALHVSQNAIHNWETGKRELKIEQIVKIANIFNVPVDYFLSDWENILENPQEWKTTEAERKQITDEKDLLRYYQELGINGKKEALKRIQELLYVPEYQKEPPAE